MNLNRSPRKTSTFRSASRIKTEASPRKSIPTHTLLKLDKLKVLFLSDKGFHKISTK